MKAAKKRNVPLNIWIQYNWKNKAFASVIMLFIFVAIITQLMQLL